MSFFRKTVSLLLPVLSLMILSACAGSGSYQSHASGQAVILAGHTRRTIAYEGPLRNPVIVIHGILGARLNDAATGREVWGTFGSDDLADADLRALALPMAKGKRLSELTDRTMAAGPLDSLRSEVLGFPVSLKGYGELVDLLAAAGYPPEGRALPENRHFHNQFFFYYDWRRSIPENVKLLHDFIQRKRSQLQTVYAQRYGLKDYDVRFDLLAHSMGGLIGRYYLMYGAQDLPADPAKLPGINRAGERYVDKFIQIGTPNLGSLDTLLELNDGLTLLTGSEPYPAAVLGTFPAYYQLLPCPPLKAVRTGTADGAPVDLYDVGVWMKYGWGLASHRADETLRLLLPGVMTAAARKEIAVDHLTKCLARAKQLAAALAATDASSVPHTTQWILFYGDSAATNAVAAVDPKTGRLTVTQTDSGDGKVSAVSARGDRRDPDAKEWSPFYSPVVPWDVVITIRGAHMGITHSEDFAHNVRLLLLQLPTPRQRNAEKILRTVKQ